LIRFYEVIILRTPGPISLNTRRSECFCASLFPFTSREVESLQKHSWQQEGNAFWGKPYRVSFYLWRRSPRWFRSVFSRSVAAKGLKTSVRNRLARYAGREDIYNREYYTYVDAEASRSAPAIVQSVIAHVAPRSIADLGCGTGALLAEFRAQAVEGTGLEYSQAALEKCRERGLNVRRWNIEEQRQPQFGPFDVVTCFEVAEHLSPACADPLVALLTALGPVVIFTAATPGQGGGADHINEQPHEYWIEKFEQKGYRLDRVLTEQWGERWQQANVASFYASNVMVFTSVRPG
jgi:SAM-dependent methyltransferase